jgi:hypothetical protein
VKVHVPAVHKALLFVQDKAELVVHKVFKDFKGLLELEPKVFKDQQVLAEALKEHRVFKVLKELMVVGLLFNNFKMQFQV